MSVGNKPPETFHILGGNSEAKLKTAKIRRANYLTGRVCQKNIAKRLKFSLYAAFHCSEKKKSGFIRAKITGKTLNFH